MALNLGILLEDRSEEFLHENIGTFSFLARKPVRRGTIVGFTLGNVNYSSKTVSGYTFSDRSRLWIRGTYPLPQVIFNRANVPSITRSKLWQVTEGRIFNSHLWLSKARVHRILNTLPELTEVLPPTCSINQTKLASLLSKYHSVYLKPYMRSQGRGIIHVIRDSTGYRYRYMREGNLYWGTSNSITRLMTELRTAMGKDKYLAQRDIDLASINGYKFDFRIMTMRTPANDWVYAGSFARIANNRGATVTNVDQGAIALSASKVLHDRFGTDGTRILAEFKRCAIRVSEELSKHYENMAIFGLDLGADRHGKVWFIEANALPGLVRRIKTQKLARAIWAYAQSLV